MSTTKRWPNIKTHEVGSFLSGPSFEIHFREIPCNCGAARGRFHTVWEENPTGHSVGCPVYMRWRAADDATAFAEALQAIHLHLDTVGVAQDEHSTKHTAQELLEQAMQCAQIVLQEHPGWVPENNGSQH